MKKVLAIFALLSSLALPFIADATDTLAFVREDTIAGTSGSITVSAGTDIAEFCFVQNDVNNTTPTSVTLGGNAMTLVAGISGGTSNFSLFIYVLVDPPTGSQTVTLTGSGTNIFCNEYSGVNQSIAYSGGGQTDNAYTHHGTSCGGSDTIGTTPIQANSWIIGASEPSSFGNATSGNTLVRRNGSPNYYYEGDTNGTVALATNNITFAYKGSGSANCITATATISPGAGGVVTISVFPFNIIWW